MCFLLELLHESRGCYSPQWLLNQHLRGYMDFYCVCGCVFAYMRVYSTWCFNFTWKCRTTSFTFTYLAEAFFQRSLKYIQVMFYFFFSSACIFCQTHDLGVVSAILCWRTLIYGYSLTVTCPIVHHYILLLWTCTCTYNALNISFSVTYDCQKFSLSTF